jgi:Raf kinase inhibitor-like YbhB/YbcL family protein
MANDPLHGLPEVPSFEVTSSEAEDGKELAKPQYSGKFGVPGGEDVSPQLSWSGAPDGTQSYVVTVFDPDAPTGSGFWHWAVADIPADVTELPAGAGEAGNAKLPGDAFQLRHDGGAADFVGAAPPAGHGVHRYFFIVHAVDVASVRDLGVTEDSTPGFLGFILSSHTLARAIMVPTAEIAG